jgi:lysylphosphatidylglycerol synthetase-like protein (DUF2156 family)
MSGDPYYERVPTAQQPVVRDQVVVEQPAPAVSSRRVVGSRSFDPAAVLAVLLAIALGVVGAVALARAGLDNPIDEPVVEVAGVSHTAVLGLVEIGMALVLLWAGLSRERGAILFVTILFGAAALVAAIEPSVGGDALSIERSWAIILAIAFGVVALVAALAPRVWRRTERVEPI